MEVPHLASGLSAINLPQMDNVGSLFHDVAAHSPPVPAAGVGTKVSIVGVGTVGAACAYGLLQPRAAPPCSELALVDCDASKLRGELMDLQHGLAFGAHCRIVADTDYAVTAGSKVCIVTAGARRRDAKQSRHDLIMNNVTAFKEIIPQLVQHSPNTIILVVSNPVDTMTYVAWKLSGLPVSNVIGSGTNLDSARFRFALSKRLAIAPDSVHGWIIGEHGSDSVPVWSGTNVAGVPLKQLNPNMGTDSDAESWDRVHTGVIDCVNEVMSLKGSTSWAISMSVADIVNAILHDGHTVHAVSTNAKGLYDIATDTFLSLPCILGHDGLRSVVRQNLSNDERLRLVESVRALREVHDKTGI